MNDYRMIRVHLERFRWEGSEKLEAWPLCFDIVVDRNNVPVTDGIEYYSGGHLYYEVNGKPSSPIVPVSLFVSTREVQKFIRIHSEELRIHSDKCGKESSDGFTNKIRVDYYEIENFLDRIISVTNYKKCEEKSHIPDYKEKYKDAVFLRCKGKGKSRIIAYYNIVDFGIPGFEVGDLG